VSIYDIASRAVRLLPAESAHRFTIDALKTGLAKPASQLDDPRLAVTLRKSGLKLPNPIGLAAGFDKNAEVFAQMLAFGFGFVECGTVTPRPQAGNPRPRLFRLDADRAVINRMGFNNEGIGMFVRRLSGAPRSIGVIGANVGANKDSEDRVADYVAGVKAVWPYSSYITINISSPNTPGLRGLQLDADEAQLDAVFDDISRLASACRFRDCRHEAEPGCAVRPAVPASRLLSYHKLQREAHRHEMTIQERHQQLAEWKARGRAAREVGRSKRG